MTRYRTRMQPNRGCGHTSPNPGVLAMALCLSLLATAHGQAQQAQQAQPSAAQHSVPPDSGLQAVKPSESPQDPDYERHVRRAVQAYQRGDWAPALKAFERAHTLQPSARTHRTVAMAAYNLGDFPKALLHLEHALADPRRPLTPSQRLQLAQLLRQAKRKVARLQLVIEPEPDRLEIDSAAPTALRDGTLVLRPGTHALTVHQAAAPPSHYPLQTHAGQYSRVHIRLPTGGADAVPSRANQSPSALRLTGYVALAAGAGALVASGITTALALDLRADLKRDCPARQCAPSQHNTLDRYDQLKDISAVAFYGGLLTGTVGLVLLLAAPNTPVDQASAELPLMPTATGLTWKGQL